jgi:hypothetical protein
MWFFAKHYQVGKTELPTHTHTHTHTEPRPDVRCGSWPFQNASLGRSESREVGDARGMFRSDYAVIAAISG